MVLKQAGIASHWLDVLSVYKRRRKVKPCSTYSTIRSFYAWSRTTKKKVSPQKEKEQPRKHVGERKPKVMIKIKEKE